MKKPLPFGVTLLAVLVLSLSALNLLRFGTAIAQWDLLAEFAARPGPLYILLTGLLWSLIGFPLSFGIWRGCPIAHRTTLPVSAFYASYYWFDRLFFQMRNEPNNQLFALGATLVLLVFVTIVIVLPVTKAFFYQFQGFEEQAPVTNKEELSNQLAQREKND